ncbi:MAG: cation:proton antiporter, partial [Bacteroidetes bacterium]|nr:cation:proton antiporter [Bacteroidota bacterium]
LVIVMGTLIGIVTGLIFYGIHRWLPITPSIEIVLSFVAPYCMYYFAESFHFSGVLAVVSGGLLLSSKRQQMLTYQGRVQGSNVWSTIGFVLNGVVFLLIGLQLPSITSHVEEVSLSQAIWYGLAISLVLIIARLLSTLGASVFTRFMGHFITVAVRNPGWKIPVIFGWSGMRGVVSLAAALSIPALTQEGLPFPYRNLILFITFIVILVTLVFQGLTLPWLIRKISPTSELETMTEREQEIIIQKKIAHTSLQYLEERYTEDLRTNEHINNLHSRMKIDVAFFNQGIEEIKNANKNSLGQFQRIYLELLEQQRTLLDKMNHKAEFDEDLIRKYLSLIDLEEFKIREKLLQEIDQSK